MPDARDVLFAQEQAKLEAVKLEIHRRIVLEMLADLQRGCP